MGLGGQEILLIGLIVLLLFGAKKIPELMKGLGKGIREFKDATKEVKDNIEKAAQAGITAIIQPGGSIRDKVVIEAANKANIAMLFTGVRHFKH